MNALEYIGKLVKIKHQNQFTFTVIDSFNENILVLISISEELTHPSDSSDIENYKISSHLLHVHKNAVVVVEDK